MKRLLKPLLGLLLLASCGGHEPTAKKATPALAPLAKDTGTVAVQNGLNPYAPVDVSPMDVAYFPVDYPIAKMTNPELGLPLARVIYSRPHKQGRTVFGTLLKYGEHWRLGANEATELELFRDVTIQGKKVAKGRYTLYCIPQADRWMIVFNNNVYSWGLKQDAKGDKYRFEIPVAKTPAPIEFFTMVFQKQGAGAGLLMAWDDVVATLPISF
jgi:hypothetical protein